jgi:hypothetical protein
MDDEGDENLLTHLAVKDHVASAGVECLIPPEVHHHLSVTYERTSLEGQAVHPVVCTNDQKGGGC